MTDTREQLITRVTNSFGPAQDGGQLSNNIALAQRIVAALLELRVIHLEDQEPQPGDRHTRAATQQDQPKKEDAESEEYSQQKTGKQQRISPKG